MVLKFYYNLENKLLPSYFDELIPKNQPVVELIQYETLKFKCQHKA